MLINFIGRIGPAKTRSKKAQNLIMPDQRFATSEDLSIVRERLARVEGGHDNLSAQMSALSDRIDSTRDSLIERIDRSAGATRAEINRTLENQGSQIREVSDEVSAMAGNIKFMGWTLFFGVTVITGLLGWAQIGDWAWAKTQVWFASITSVYR